MPKKIQICMGSSCFARGNNKNLQVLTQYLKDNPKLMAEIEKAIKADANELSQKMILDDHAPAFSEDSAAAPISE